KNELTVQLLDIAVGHADLMDGHDGFMMGGLFERLIAYDKKKERGQYYTPEQVTSMICRNAISAFLLDMINKRYCSRYDSLEDYIGGEHIQYDPSFALEVMKRIRILDPACGCGHFLESAFRAMMDIYATLIPSTGAIIGVDALSREEVYRNASIRSHIVQNNLFGVDISAGAIKLCKARLLMMLYEDGCMPEGDSVDLNIEKGDALLGFTDSDAASTTYIDIEGIAIMPSMAKALEEGEYAPFDMESLEDGGLGALLRLKAHLVNVLANISIGKTSGIEGLISRIDELSSSILDNAFHEMLNEAGIKGLEAIDGLFHWPVEFSGIASGGFDIIVGNPPYGKIKNMGIPKKRKVELSKMYKHLYRLTGTNIDIYKLFIERCLGLMHPESYFSMVIPAMFWGDKDSFPLREELFSHDVRSVMYFPLESTRKLFQESVNYEVSIFSVGMKPRDREDKGTLIYPNMPADGFGRQSDNLSYLLRMDEIAGHSRLLRIPTFSSIPLEREIFSKLRGFKRLGDKADGASLHIFVGKLDESVDRDFLSSEPTGDLLIASNHIKDWYLDLSPKDGKKRWIKDIGAFRKRRLKVPIMGARNVGELMDIGPKIIGRQMANRGERRKLHFTLHYGNNILTNGVRTIMVDTADDRVHRTLLALLNSTLFNWYFSIYSHTYNVKPYEIRELPMIELSEDVKDFYGKLSNLLLFSASLTRNGHLELDREYSALLRLLDSSIYDKFLFDGKHGIIDISQWHLMGLDFKAWQEEHRVVECVTDQMPSLEAAYADRLRGSVSRMEGDERLMDSIEEIYSSSWVRQIERALS
ncbi:MAG: Eco57I restriction-modification methylase domain-containing protein, partial [Candidatus Methanofastidiosa archaeon]|nr:Eco57I restriction-modification methylase domain-containing protein [Candidatus Methanofastidiosa archaeon]